MAQMVLSLFLELALAGAALGAVYEVGDAAGWTIVGNVDYAKWASGEDFHTGDSLVFRYNNQFHNVKQVTHQDFQSCNAASPIASYATGSDSIDLKSPGHYYFLCGAPGHCQLGQKVDILVNPASIRGPIVSPGPASYISSPS